LYLGKSFFDSNGEVNDTGQLFVISHGTKEIRKRKRTDQFYSHWMHVLMGVACYFNFIIDSNNCGLVDKTGKPFLCQSGVPWCVYISLIGNGSDIGTIGEQTVSGIAVVRIEGLLI